MIIRGVFHEKTILFILITCFYTFTFYVFGCGVQLQRHALCD